MDIREVVLKHTLLNAYKYGKPDKKAVVGKILGENPEFRSRVREILSIVDEVLAEVSSLTKDEIEAKLRERFPESISEETRKKEKGLSLPPLPDVKNGVIMRFAPNPNGPATLGSARGIVINHEYVQIYGGEFILRFDDTDPKTKAPLPEAYDQYLEDCEWLGAKPDKVLYASERLDIYYEYAVKLIEMERAYTCLCKRDEFKRYRDLGISCPHRDIQAEESISLWEKMLEGEFDEGEIVLRIKTDMSHPDPAVRDWVAFRILKVPHPRVGDRYVVWPTLDFESAIEDRINGITHIIRGKDLMDSEKRQRYIYDYFGWKYPHVKLWGRVKVHEFGKFSTSMIRKMIEEGKYEGWDDIRLPTLIALRRRGISPEAIRKFFISLGVGENDVSVSMKNLYAENRKIIDPVANRYFFVWDPVKVELRDFEGGTAEIPLHPKKTTKRVLEVQKDVFITSADLENFDTGDLIRLKGLGNFILTSKNPPEMTFRGSDLKNVKKGRNIIHWLPVEYAIPCRVLRPENIHQGYVEKGIEREIDRVVQFERYGFVRIESAGDEIISVFTHE